MKIVCNCEIEIRLTGEAAKLLSLLSLGALKEAVKEIRLAPQVCFPPYRRPEFFKLPTIQNGDVEEAYRSLANLLRQRALDSEQYDLLTHSLGRARDITKD